MTAAYDQGWIEGYEAVAAMVPGFALQDLDAIELVVVVRSPRAREVDVVLVARVAPLADAARVAIRLRGARGRLPDLIADGGLPAGELFVEDLRAAPRDGATACLYDESSALRLDAREVSLEILGAAPLDLTIVTLAASLVAAVGDGPVVLILPAWTDEELAEGLAAFAALPPDACCEVVALGPRADELHDRLDDVIVLADRTCRTVGEAADAEGLWAALRLPDREMRRVAWAPVGSPLALHLALAA